MRNVWGLNESIELSLPGVRRMIPAYGAPLERKRVCPHIRNLTLSAACLNRYLKGGRTRRLDAGREQMLVRVARYRCSGGPIN